MTDNDEIHRCMEKDGQPDATAEIADKAEGEAHSQIVEERSEVIGQMYRCKQKRGADYDRNLAVSPRLKPCPEIAAKEQLLDNRRKNASSDDF